MTPIAVESAVPATDISPAPVTKSVPDASSNANANSNASRVVGGKALDDTSDAVDLVNQIKGKQKQQGLTDEEADAYAKSKFDAEKDKTEFRNYEEAMDSVKIFYKTQHEKQTVEFNLAAREKYLGHVHSRMTVWQAIEKLDTLVDDSDPDTSLSQIQHLLQTAEAIRKDGKPDWMQLTGLIHDLGKLLVFPEWGAEGQWDVVGDTFVVGAKFSEKNVLPQTFEGNPDSTHPVYSTELGIYKEKCGLENVMLSWGHDEYLYHICKKQSKIPQAGLNMIRYHSFYPWHREGAYHQFMNEEDEQALKDVLAFNPYDLYSKSDDPPKVEELKPYYESLIAKYFPNPVVEW